MHLPGALMAVMDASVCLALTLLMCLPGGQTIELLSATATSGDSLAPPRVLCRCSSYPNVTYCSWPEPSVSPPTQYIASFSERHRQSVVQQSHIIRPGASSSFQPSAPSPSAERVWHSFLPNLKLLTDYIMNVTAVYPNGSSSHLSSFMLEEIVKPDPPVDIRASPLNFRHLLLEWSPPPTWANLDILPLKYQILYQWESRGTTKSVNVRMNTQQHGEKV
ncbi:uncharacterized protein V6R79_000809 [Siganus canaliculatus]